MSIEQMQECSYCGFEFDDIENDLHECSCGQEITAKQCKENSGLCGTCLYLLDK